MKILTQKQDALAARLTEAPIGNKKRNVTNLQSRRLRCFHQTDRNHRNVFSSAGGYTIKLF